MLIAEWLTFNKEGEKELLKLKKQQMLAESQNEENAK